MKPKSSSFIWDFEKERLNILKHGVDFRTAAKVFQDPEQKIYVDEQHSREEPRYFCIGRVDERILTVRFVCREEKIRIFGAGYWRKGWDYYEEKRI